MRSSKLKAIIGVFTFAIAIVLFTIFFGPKKTSDKKIEDKIQVEEKAQNPVEEREKIVVKKPEEKPVEKVQKEDKNILVIEEENFPSKEEEVVVENKPVESVNVSAKPVEKPIIVKPVEKAKEKPAEKLSPLDEKIKTKYHDFMNGKAEHKIGRYVLDKMKNYEFIVKLDDVRKDLNMPNLTFIELMEHASAALMQNPQFAIPNAGSISENDHELPLNFDNIPTKEVKKRRDFIKQKVVEWLDPYNFDGKSDYEKSLMLNDIMIKKLTYDHALAYYKYPETFSYNKEEAEKTIGTRLEESVAVGELYTSLKYNKAVCEGYALIYQVLAQAVGLDSYYVGGQIDYQDGIKMEHAWNWVKLGDKYFVVDVTWNDGDLPDENIVMKTKWLHLPVDFVRQIRGHEISYFNYNTIDKEGKDFNYTWYGQNKLLYKSEDVEKVFTEKIMALKKENPQDSSRWRILGLVIDSNDQSLSQIVERINQKLNTRFEGVTVYEGIVEYMNYQKYYGYTEEDYEEAPIEGLPSGRPSAGDKVEIN